MGRMESAVRIFTALVALIPEGLPDALDRKNLASLAALEVERGNGDAALSLLHRVMDGRLLATRDAPLHLLRARALWQQGRKEEARAAVNEYAHIAGATAETLHTFHAEPNGKHS